MPRLWFLLIAASGIKVFLLLLPDVLHNMGPSDCAITARILAHINELEVVLTRR